MDGSNFQSQMRVLEQRVAAMSSSSEQQHAQPWPPVHACHHSSYGPRDAFHDQLGDIRAQLDRMQYNLAQHHMRGGRPFLSTSPLDSTPDGQHRNQASSAFPQSPYVGAPVAPMFAEMHQALKLDVRHIDERVTGLEQSISELEDRIDNQDPWRFTPPGSEVGADGIGREEERSKPSRPNATLPVSLSLLANSGVQGGSNLNIEAVVQGLLVLLASIGSSQSGIATPPVETSEKQTYPKVDKNTASMRPQASHASGVEYRDREIERLDELLTSTTAATKATEDSLAQKDERIASLAYGLRKADERATQVSVIINGQSEELREKNESLQRVSFDLEKANSSRQHFMTKYVDENYRFRWLKQKKLQSEHRLQQQVEELENHLKQVQQGYDSTNDGATRAYIEYKDELARLQAFCEEKDAIASQQEEIIARGARLIEERDVAIDDLRRSKLKSQRSQEFAMESRDRLLVTLKQRDDEIVRLRALVKSASARASRADFHLRNREEADAIADAIDRDVSAVDGRESVRHKAPATEQVKEVSEPLAQAAQAVKSGRRLHTAASWSPRPLGEYSRLPHEESRALAWEEGYQRDGHAFGAVSPIKPSARRSSKSNRASRSVSHADPDAQGGFAPNGEHQHIRAATPKTQRTSLEQRKRVNVSTQLPPGLDNSAQETVLDSCRPVKRDRYALPLDATFWPPLPAPIAADGRVGSVPDLHAACQDAGTIHLPNVLGVDAISKPASMNELPRPKLQAYVETEAESGEEKDGASLLD